MPICVLDQEEWKQDEQLEYLHVGRLTVQGNLILHRKNMVLVKCC